MTDQTAPNDPPAATVYYDGACPLCAQEVRWYRAMPGRIDWVDVSGAGGPPAPDLDSEAALARFHVRDAEGRLVSGGAAFVALWAAIPRLRPFARVLGAPPLRWLLEPGYRVFLWVRPVLQRFARGRQPNRASSRSTKARNGGQ